MYIIIHGYYKIFANYFLPEYIQYYDNYDKEWDKSKNYLMMI